MDELRKLRESFFLNQSMKQQFASTSHIHNKSQTESVNSERIITLEQKNTEKPASLRNSVGKLQPKILLEFNPDGVGESRESFNVPKIKAENTMSFQRRRLDFNPELTKTLTNQLRKPHQASLGGFKRDNPSKAVLAIKPVKPTIGLIVPRPKELESSQTGNELSQPIDSHLEANLSESSQIVKKSFSRSSKIFIPHFKSFSSDHSRSMSTSKHADNEEHDKAEHSGQGGNEEEILVPEGVGVKESKVASKITANDVLLFRCRQMMTELQEIKKESDYLNEKLSKYKAFQCNPEFSEKFRVKTIEENNRLNSKLAEIKPQLLIAQKKFETSAAKLDRAKQLSVTLFVRKRDLEIKKSFELEYRQKLEEIRSKIASFKENIDRIHNRNEMERTLMIQHREARWRGQVLDSIYAVARDYNHCSDEEGRSLLDLIAKLKENLTQT